MGVRGPFSRVAREGGLCALMVFALAGLERTARAQAVAAPPPPPAAAAAPQPPAVPLGSPTDASCITADNCPALNVPNDTLRFQFFAFKAGLSCKQALDKLGATPGATDEDFDTVRHYYYANKRSSPCDEPHKLVRGAVDTAILVSTGRRGLFGMEQGLQILPSFALGIPFLRDDGTAAGRALKGLKALAGVTIRYSPVSFWASVHGVLGTAQVDSSALDKAIYTNPSLVGAGVGIDVLGGILSVTYFHMMLRPDGIDSGSRSSTGYVDVGIDLTSVGVGIAGLTK